MNLLQSLCRTRFPAFPLAQCALHAAGAASTRQAPPLLGQQCSANSFAFCHAFSTSTGSSLLGSIPLSEIASLAACRRSLLLQHALDEADDL